MCSRLCLSVSEYCLLYTSDAADEEDSVDLGGRRIIKTLIFNVRYQLFDLIGH